MHLPHDWLAVGEWIRNYMTATPGNFAGLTLQAYAEDQTKATAFITGVFIGLMFNEMFQKADEFMHVLMSEDFRDSLYAPMHYGIIALTYPHRRELGVREPYYNWVSHNMRSWMDMASLSNFER